MDDLDFSSPAPKPGAKADPQAELAARNAAQATVAAQSPLYNPALALEFFRATGTVELKPASKPIFSEGEKAGGLFSKGARMYLLLEGEIGLMIIAGSAVKQGEIFGELAVIAGLPRSATAMAKADCKVLSLAEKQFHAALQKTPEFALMLMSIMGNRLRQSIAKLNAAGPARNAASERSSVLDKKLLAELAAELGGPPPQPIGAGKTIVSAGAAGAFMYVVMDGRVAISIGAQIAERIGAGAVRRDGLHRPRAAPRPPRPCTLLAIGRNDFLRLVKAKPLFGALLLRSTAERMQQLAGQVAQLPA
jgi:CRP-like cAMP-binding protein